MTIHHTNANTI